MRANSKVLMLTATFIIVLTILISSGYMNTEPYPVQLKGSVRMLYNYPEGSYVKYLQKNRILQTMDIESQPMQVIVDGALGCSIRGNGVSGKNIKIEILIDTLGQTIDTPQGYSGGAVQSVMGKTINLVISPAGRGTDLSEAERLVYFIEGSGESSAYQNFHDFFPLLPENPVKAGETWESTDTASISTAVMSMKTITNSVNKFEGIERINGIDCAKITSDLSGSQVMSTETQGMAVYTSGTFEGTSTLFFAVKEGYFIEKNTTAKLSGIIDVSGQMRFPLTMETTSSTKMIN